MIIIHLPSLVLVIWRASVIQFLLQARLSRSLTLLKDCVYRSLIWCSSRQAIRTRSLELGFNVLHTDSLVRQAAIINLEKNEKDRFSRKICYSSSNPLRQTLTSSSSTGSQQSKALSWNIFKYVSRSSPEHSRIRPSSGRENLALT